MRDADCGELEGFDLCLPMTDFILSDALQFLTNFQPPAGVADSPEMKTVGLRRASMEQAIARGEGAGGVGGEAVEEVGGLGGRANITREMAHRLKTQK